MTLRYSRQKIEATLQLLAEFEAASFPHADSNEAIRALKRLLRIATDQLTPQSSSILAAQAEMEATSLISEILELLGVISNSANVRNSFEIHGPVLDLVSRLLADDDANLIISFEWDYIPYTYAQSHPYLPSFVIIGLPASEASNALVLPVIGHELGHSLWRREKCRGRFEPEVNRQIVSSIKGPFRSKYESVFGRAGIRADECDSFNNLWTWERAAEDALKQVEELFSDFTGLFLFSTSYLDSFEYLLSPTLSVVRGPEYPEVAVRAKCLRDNSTKIGVAVHPEFVSSFASQKSPFRVGSNNQLQMELADAASNSLASNVADQVFSVCASRGIRTPSIEETEELLANFLLGVPAQRTPGIGAIMNAGWSAFKAVDFMPKASDASRMAAINELVLKSVEVFEIERMTGHGPKKKRSEASPGRRG